MSAETTPVVRDFDSLHEIVKKAAEVVSLSRDDFKSIAEKADSIQIRNNEEAETAAAFLTFIVKVKKAAEGKRDELLEFPKKGIEKIRDQFRPDLEALMAAEKTIKDKGEAYHKKLRAQEMAEQRRLTEKAEKERQRALERARAAEERGDTAKAEAFMEKAASVAAPKVAQTKLPKGMSAKETWVGEVVDKESFIFFVAAALETKAPMHEAFVELITVDSTALNRLARAAGGSLDIPGLMFTKKVTIANV